MATVGGTVSQLTGGKFANGAVTGAFVHLFNAEIVRLMRGTNTNAIKERSKYYTNESKMARGKTIYDQLQTYSKPMMATGVTGVAVLTGGVVIEAGIALIGPYYTTVSTIVVADGIQSYFSPAPKLNYVGASSWIIGMVKKGAF